ncbi:MAG: amidase family protein [Paracoccaceae bacterium]
MTAPSTTIDHDLCLRPRPSSCRLFRAGKLSPVEVLEAQLARAEAVEPVINAFTETFAEEAMAAARRAEEVWLKRPDMARPLEGITVAIKDEMPVKGQRNTQGLLIYKDYIADHTHPVATRLQEAGADLSRPHDNAGLVAPGSPHRASMA